MASFVKATKLENGSGASASGSVSSTATNALFAVGTEAVAGGNTTYSVSGGGTWTSDGHVGSATPNLECGTASCPSATGGSQTITVTFGAGAATTAFIYEFSGAASSSLLDVLGSGNNGSGSPVSTAALTNTNAADIFLAVAATNSGSANEAPASTGTSWTMPAGGSEPNGNSFLAAMSGYLIVSSTGSQTETWTINDAVTWEALIVCYKAAAAAAGPIVQMMTAGDQSFAGTCV